MLGREKKYGGAFSKSSLSDPPQKKIDYKPLGA